VIETKYLIIGWYSIEYQGWRMEKERQEGVRTGGRAASKKREQQEGLRVAYITFSHQKTPPNILPVNEKCLGVLVVPEVLFPYRGRIWLGSAISDGLEAISEPPFAHRGPTPDIDATVFPGCNLWPP
jgi:hypothetical protein